MNLYEKIQKVRCELKTHDIKMTGKNPFAKYDYMELNDFLPTLNKLMLDNKMTAIPSFDGTIASLTAFDFESEQTLTITSPMGSADLKGCHEVQNIGAVETYQRRYLYMAMFDIAESDALNGTSNNPDDKNTPKKPLPKGEPKVPITQIEPKEIPNMTTHSFGDNNKCCICGRVVEAKLAEGSRKAYKNVFCSGECKQKGAML